MAESASDDIIKVPDPVMRLCRWIWKKRGFLFGIDLLSLILGGLPLLDVTPWHNLLIVQIFALMVTFWQFFLFILVIILFITIICVIILLIYSTQSSIQLQIS